jgi:hypothetical protein
MNRDRMRLLLTHPRNGRSMPLKKQTFLCIVIVKFGLQNSSLDREGRKTKRVYCMWWLTSGAVNVKVTLQSKMLLKSYLFYGLNAGFVL